MLNQVKGGITNLIEIAQLSTGSSFGELALIKDQPRRATVVCTEDTYVMILNKEHYLRILGKYFAKKLDDKIEFLHGLKIFNV